MPCGAAAKGSTRLILGRVSTCPSAHSAFGRAELNPGCACRAARPASLRLAALAAGCLLGELQAVATVTRRRTSPVLSAASRPGRPCSAARDAPATLPAAAGPPHGPPGLPARSAPALRPRPAPRTSLCRPGEYPPLFSTLFAPSSNLSSSASRAYLNQSDNRGMRMCENFR